MFKKKRDSESVFCYVLVIILALMCLFPVIIAASSSFTPEAELLKNGYSVFPKSFTLDTYDFLLSNKGKLLFRAYSVTILSTFLGTIYTMVVTTCFAYVVAQKKTRFPGAEKLAFFAWFTTVFSGGVLPWYILCTKYYGLYNNIWALFIPNGMNVFNMFILRNNFRALPEELIDAARIDGASNWTIFTKIEIPLIKSGMVTVGLFTVLMYWNDFYLSLYLVTKTEFYTVQRFLYNMMANISALLSGIGSDVAMQHMVMPTNTAKMAMTVLTVLPIAIAFPFAQKYFAQGLTVGAVKG